MSGKLRKTLVLLTAVILASFLVLGFGILPIGASPDDNGVNDENKVVTSLDISKDVDSVSGGGLEPTLSKTASETAINMIVGDTHDVTFTIIVDALAGGNTFSISGDIFVENTGEHPAFVTDVSDTVWYKAGGPAWLPTASSITTTVPAEISVGAHTYSYSGTFTLPVPLDDVTAMSNLIEITISNHAPPPGEPNTFHFREDFAKPSAGETVFNLSDIETILPAAGVSFVVNSVTLNGSPASFPMQLDLEDAPFTVVISKTLTAEAAGDYVLNNLAILDGLQDDVDVLIHVEEEVIVEEAGAIVGTKYLDANGNGALDEGEGPLAGVTIRLRNSEGDIIDEVLTDALGQYAFTNLPPGQYSVEEVVPAGMEATSDISSGLMDLADEETIVFDFFNREVVEEERLGDIRGVKYLDANGNGALDEGEGPLAGVTIRLRNADGDIIAIAVTDANGAYAFEGLLAGQQYSVEEVVPAGFQATGPVSSGLMLLESGDILVVNFFNQEIPGVVEPEAPPAPVAPEAVAPEAVEPQELPRTGFGMIGLLISMMLVFLSGLGLTAGGLKRMKRN
jgi:hypothetical protein